MLERMARDHFIDAIGEVNVRNIVYYREPSTLDEAVRVAIKVKNREEYDNPRSGKRTVSARAVTFVDPEVNVQKPEVDVQKELVNTLKGMQVALETVSEQVNSIPQARKQFKNNHVNGTYKSEKKEPGVMCYNCGAEGHRIKDCRHRPLPPQRTRDRESQTPYWRNRHHQGQGN